MKKSTDNFIITKEQKVLANEEFRKFHEDPNYGLDWDEVKQQLGFDDVPGLNARATKKNTVS